MSAGKATLMVRVKAQQVGPARMGVHDGNGVLTGTYEVPRSWVWHATCEIHCHLWSAGNWREAYEKAYQHAEERHSEEVAEARRTVRSGNGASGDPAVGWFEFVKNGIPSETGVRWGMVSGNGLPDNEVRIW